MSPRVGISDLTESLNAWPTDNPVVLLIGLSYFGGISGCFRTVKCVLSAIYFDPKMPARYINLNFVSKTDRFFLRTARPYTILAQPDVTRRRGNRVKRGSTWRRRVLRRNALFIWLERAEFFEKPVQCLGGYLVNVAVASAGDWRNWEVCHFRCKLSRTIRPALQLICQIPTSSGDAFPSVCFRSSGGELYL